ncbi:hypothetical protein [Streptomyces rubradiris]|uniref:Uncharacterized protein n=1 Tax=Streptomyces rubradiris TaxID=285531 RepID=A0ABQ3R3H4_STRRR|nr:hypothetical protein [Streptomyces rubradiris]GHH30158.1 hypothetical protein GCM10018792_76270 [Streptomyces rubradiris]GHI50408.1 hypothetical protein Srubr_02540 [Streptomyces rubradiris]
MSAPTTAQWLRAAVDRVAVGSPRLGAHWARRTIQRLRRTSRRARTWVGEASGFDKAFRLALLAAAVWILRKVGVRLGGWAYHRIESGAWWWLLAACSTVWIAAAYRAGRADWQPAPVPAPADVVPGGDDAAEAKQAPSEPAVEQVPASAGPPPVSPVALIAAVRDIGTPHAQLVPLAEHLGTTTEAVRTAAAGMGWPVKDVRMKGRSSAAGLRGDEVPSLPPVDPSSGVVGAGQPADDNDDDSGEEGPGEGVRVVRTDGGLIVYDLADTHRRRGTVRA